MAGVRATPAIQTGVGGWKIIAHVSGQAPIDVTFFRGVPTVIESWAIQDPFGPSSCALRFPAATFYEAIGVSADTLHINQGVNYDIIWTGPVPPGYPRTKWVWEGFSRSIEYTEVGIGLTLVGAMFQLDDYLAKPEYPMQPIAYETAIRRQFLGKPHLRLSTMQFKWPPGWNTIYAAVPNELPGLVPTGTQEGEYWSGMVTRDTGSFDPALTGYLASLLGNWYTNTGRFTLSLLPGRVPLLHHLKILDGTEVQDNTHVVIHPLHPGVKISLTADWSQTANVFYGQSKSLSGEAYSGFRVIGDGLAIEYDPMAALITVDPVQGKPTDAQVIAGNLGVDLNASLDISVLRKEVKLELGEGLNAAQAKAVGAYHLKHFAAPGLVGTITLTSDVTLNAVAMHRSLILPGMVVALPGFGGSGSRLLMVSEVSWDGVGGVMTLTVDSKCRDKLTTDEVKIRGRDAMSIPRMIIGGRYRPTFSDTMLPWNYADGSGYIPSSPGASARNLFQDMPYNIDFPWTKWTTQRPPSNPLWTKSYIKINPKSVNASENWAFTTRTIDKSGQGPAGSYAVPIKMAAAGGISLVQLAAYDAAGNVLKVPFHFSLYYQPGTNVQAMPKIPAAAVGADGYTVGQHYPFFAQAWETYDLDGSLVGTEVPVSVSSSGLIQGWGNRAMKAGHWPGTSADNDPATGLLVDEAPWTFNLVGQTPNINQYVKNDLGVYAGYIYAMIYCDAQLAQPVYFMGRMYRGDPGGQV